jgi:hypothetical protein
MPGSPGKAVVGPVEIRADDHRLRYIGTAVRLVGRPFRVVEVIGKDRLVPVYLSFNCLGVGVQQ